MLKVYAIKNGVESLINDGEDIVISGTLKEAELTIPTFDFEIYRSNKYFGLISAMNTEIEVIDTLYNEVLFLGYVVGITTVITNDGDVYKSVTCDGIEGYLRFSSVAMVASLSAIDYTADTYSFGKIIEYRLACHNDFMTEESRKFYYDEADYSVSAKYIDDKENNWESVKLCCQNCGRYLKAERKNGKNYLVSINTNQNSSGAYPEIRIGYNILEFKEEIDTGEIATCIIPFGDYNPNNSLYRIDISEANDGKIYLENQPLINKYGKIYKTVIYENGKTPWHVKRLAGGYKWNDTRGATFRYTVKGIDMSYYESKYSRLKLMNYYHLSAAVVSINVPVAQLVEITRNLNNPALCDLVFKEVIK